VLVVRGLAPYLGAKALDPDRARVCAGRGRVGVEGYDRAVGAGLTATQPLRGSSKRLGTTSVRSRRWPPSWQRNAAQPSVERLFPRWLLHRVDHELGAVVAHDRHDLEQIRVTGRPEIEAGVVRLHGIADEDIEHAMRYTLAIDDLRADGWISTQELEYETSDGPCEDADHVSRPSSGQAPGR
jgi:hypothetical protein